MCGEPTRLFYSRTSLYRTPLPLPESLCVVFELDRSHQQVEHFLPLKHLLNHTYPCSHPKTSCSSLSRAGWGDGASPRPDSGYFLTITSPPTHLPQTRRASPHQPTLFEATLPLGPHLSPGWPEDPFIHSPVILSLRGLASACRVPRLPPR